MLYIHRLKDNSKPRGEKPARSRTPRRQSHPRGQLLERRLVYDLSGKLRDVITVPERPLGLVFGGKDHRTLYIPAGTSLYAMHLGKTASTRPSK